MTQEVTIAENIKGVNTPYYGMGLISSILGGIGYGFESNFFFGCAGAIGVLGASLFLFGKFKNIKFLENGIVLRRGLIGWKQSFDFDKIERLQLIKERGQSGLDIISTDLQKIDNWKVYKYLTVQVKGKTVNISQNDFNELTFQQLAHSFQHYFLEANGSPSQKLERLQQKTEGYAEKDRKLRSEFEQSLYEACKSTFMPLETLYSSETIKELDQNPKVIFHTIKQGNVLVYFRSDQQLPQKKEKSVEVALSLIATIKENLNIVTSRLRSHEEVRQKLIRLGGQFRNRERLQYVANKVGQLQEKNMGHATQLPDLAFETEVIEQYEQLTEHIHNTETLEKSMELKEHLNLFKEINLEESQLLKEINKKLKE